VSEITREQALAHFGVKGMKWGVRNEETGGRRKATSQEIMDARITTQARTSSIFEADRRVRTASTPAEKKKALADVERLAKQLAESDDTRVANMMTSGEKAAAVLVTGPIGLLIIRSNKKQTTEERWNANRQKAIASNSGTAVVKKTG
jgi:hypothetical protein